MFLFKKKNKTNDIIKYLEKADDAYMTAFETRDVSEFSKYCTRDVLRQVKEMVMSGDDIYLGLDRYRHREWFLVKEGNTVKVYFKKITHDPVELVHKIAVAIADNISEEWTLLDAPSGYVITEIRRM